MLNKLQTLEQALGALNTQYHVVATELANLKNKPNNDAKNEATIADLQQKLAHSQNRVFQLQDELDRALGDAGASAEQNERLLSENQKLTQENAELKQKNRIAIERAELIQTWLNNIDNAAC